MSINKSANHTINDVERPGIAVLVHNWQMGAGMVADYMQQTLTPLPLHVGTVVLDQGAGQVEQRLSLKTNT